MGNPHLFSPTPCGERGFSFSRGLESKSFHRSLSDQEGLGGLLTHLSPWSARAPCEKGGPCVWLNFPASRNPRWVPYGGLIASYAGRHGWRTLPRAHTGCLELPQRFH